jgi:hypothetical protein
MAKTESEIGELMNKRIDAACADEKDRKTSRNRAGVNLHALTVGFDRPGVRTLEQVAKYIADNPHDHSLQALRDRLAPAAPKPEWKPRRFQRVPLFTFNSTVIWRRFSRTQSFFGTRHQTTDKCHASTYRKVTRFRHTVLRSDLPSVLWEVVHSNDTPHGGFTSQWVLVARDPKLLQADPISRATLATDDRRVLWTDDHASLVQVLWRNSFETFWSMTH